MPKIDATIIQPLRWYDSITKQNFRRPWVKGLRKFNTVITPAHSIIPFQIRRYHSVMPVTTLDIYDAETDVYINSVLSLLPAPVNNHIKIYSLGVVDNIVYSQISAFVSNMVGGYYYLHFSDGVNNFYSEVFMVSCDFEPQTLEGFTQISNDFTPVELLTVNNTGELLEIYNIPY